MKLGEREILLTYGNFELAKQPYVNSGDAKDYIERVFSAFVPNLAFMEIDQMSMYACIHSRITPRNLVYAEEIHIVNGTEKHVPVTNIEVIFPLARKLHYGYDDVLERVGNLTNVGVPFGEAVLRVRSTMNVQEIKMNVTLTEMAVEKLGAVLDQKGVRNTHALRVFVKGGGCGGMQYGMTFDDDVQDTDHVFEQHGLRVIVDPTSMMYVSGASIDYEDNLMGGGFQIDNPNATSSCGCGSSFRTNGAPPAGGGCGSGG